MVTERILQIYDLNNKIFNCFDILSEINYTKRKKKYFFKFSLSYLKFR